MAQLHGNGWSHHRTQPRQFSSPERWSIEGPDDAEVAQPIALRGSTYLAFCKVWAPVWIDEEDETLN
jgi:hypothetical protein